MGSNHRRPTALQSLATRSRPCGARTGTDGGGGNGMLTVRRSDRPTVLARVWLLTCHARVTVTTDPLPGRARSGDVRDELARKAALAGKSLQSYLLGELTKLSERPSMAEIVARNQARARATGSTVTMSDAVAAVRAERDRHES
jgi:antitoxin FitA